MGAKHSSGPFTRPKLGKAQTESSDAFSPGWGLFVSNIQAQEHIIMHCCMIATYRKHASPTQCWWGAPVHDSCNVLAEGPTCWSAWSGSWRGPKMSSLEDFLLFHLPYQDLLRGSLRYFRNHCVGPKNGPRKSWVHRNLHIGGDIVIVSIVGLSGCRINGACFCFYQTHRWSTPSSEHGVVCQENHGKSTSFQMFSFSKDQTQYQENPRDLVRWNHISSTILDWRTPWSRHCFVVLFKWAYVRLVVTQRLAICGPVVSNMFRWSNSATWYSGWWLGHPSEKY